MIPDRYRALEYEDCTRERLAELSVNFGIDAATAFFYERIRRAPRNREIVAALDGEHDGDGPHWDLDSHARILIAPALFYRERPDIGGDGAIVQAAARRAGVGVEVLPIGSAGTVRANAAELRHLLAERCADPTVLVSLSKGAADVRVALESMRTIPAGLRAWVIVSGLVHGTPAIDHLLGRWWRRWTLETLLARAGAPLEMMRELAASSSLNLDAQAVAPPGLLVVNLIGCPLTRHLSTRFGRMRHRQLAHLGPNDGLTLLRDAIVEPGLAYPVWGADHYLRTPSVSRVVSRLITFLAAQGCFARRQRLPAVS